MEESKIRVSYSKDNTDKELLNVLRSSLWQRSSYTDIFISSDESKCSTVTNQEKKLFGLFLMMNVVKGIVNYLRRKKVILLRKSLETWKKTRIVDITRLNRALKSIVSTHKNKEEQEKSFAFGQWKHYTWFFCFSNQSSSKNKSKIMTLKKKVKIGRQNRETKKSAKVIQGLEDENKKLYSTLMCKKVRYFKFFTHLTRFLHQYSFETPIDKYLV